MLNAHSHSNAVSPTERRAVVMVVEDELIIREFVCEILAEEGLETAAFENADDAWAAFGEGEKHFDLLLTDIRMPGSMDGAELARRVQQQWPQLPIIVMSGHETPETADIGKVQAFVPKPWTIGVLTDEVMKAILLEETQSVR